MADWKTTELDAAAKKVVSDRAARDAAVALVLEKDAAFKTLLVAAQDQEETVMALYITAMAAKKVWTDTQAEEAVA